ncbi:hypothetical protein [Antrihabitans stalactiti]|uniref:Uncharacterized protein n=1 Tax=Antrihabitans stalactiti TaxID=2584121 RepID=A0A848KGL9_9NOCA|nr:hypothetical protein [Antrihabitans stalactiti]NMN95067.1 hypothetical protein [Antrihabitans stalactiti]
MTKCPRCFHPVDPNNYVWMCVSGRCEAKPDPAASAFTGGPVASGPILQLRQAPGAAPGWAPPDGAACPTCNERTPEVCAMCHYRYPEGWRQAQATCIAMAGARATGKSLYIAVVIKQLEQLGERLGCSVEPATQLTQTNYQTYYEKPLYEERGLMQSTQRADVEGSYQREPLIFSLGLWGGVRRYVVIRDVAGEDLESSASQALHLSFFANADGVFFMFDPLKVSEIRDQLMDLVPSQLRIGGEPKTVLSNVLMSVGIGTPKVAVILSKFDALQALRKVDGSEWSQLMANPGAAYLRDPSMSVRYNDVDGELLHQEVRSLLLKLHAGPLVAAVENPTSGAPIPFRFFAVSALGDSPIGENIHSRGIAPFRCVDPVRWILSPVGVL